MTNIQTVPTREQVPAGDRWNVESIYATTEDWEKDFADWTAKIPQYA